MQGVFISTIIAFLSSAIFHVSGWTPVFYLENSSNIDPYVLWTDTSASSEATYTNVKSLVADNIASYRSSRLDDWDNDRPAKIRLCFRNSLGEMLFYTRFNSSNSNLTNWFTVGQKFVDTIGENFQIQRNFGGYDGRFSVLSSQLDIHGTVLHSPSNWTLFLFSAGYTPTYLPQEYPSILTCVYKSATREIPYLHSVINITWGYCLSFCRDLNYISAVLNDVSCGCYDEWSGVTFDDTDCNVPCPGEPAKFCGGDNPSIAQYTLIDTRLNTSALFREPDEVLGPKFGVLSSLEIFFTVPQYVAGYRVEAPLNQPVEVLFQYRSIPGVNCSGYENFDSFDVNLTFNNLMSEDHFETKMFVCTRIYFYNSTGQPLDYLVNVTLIEPIGLLKAPIMTVEAKYEIEDQCQCDCLLYNQLYGTSPYENLTYAEKEEALQDEIARIEKELTVNKTELSSTIRKKTSATDDRTSAVVVGYSLGVALLIITFGSIVLLDVPTILTNLKLFYEYLKESFNNR